MVVALLYDRGMFGLRLPAAHETPTVVEFTCKSNTRTDSPCERPAVRRLLRQCVHASKQLLVFGIHVGNSLSGCRQLSSMQLGVPKGRRI